MRAREYLLECGVRPSVHRVAIMDYLFKHKTHPTADEIFFALQRRIPTLSRSTVYNTLTMLADCGAILAVDIDRKQMHYDAETAPHAHFHCVSCGAIHDISADAEEWQRLWEVAPPPPGATVISAQLSYKGVCKKCNEKQNKIKLTTNLN